MSRLFVLLLAIAAIMALTSAQWYGGGPYGGYGRGGYGYGGGPYGGYGRGGYGGYGGGPYGGGFGGPGGFAGREAAAIIEGAEIGAVVGALEG
uniref:Glycine-rich cell wall structural protein n=1 Tax=Panagrellus redivivus TaxID=6233 RepID=A0A7E4UV37_PANRE